MIPVDFHGRNLIAERFVAAVRRAQYYLWNACLLLGIAVIAAQAFIGFMTPDTATVQATYESRVAAPMEFNHE